MKRTPLRRSRGTVVPPAMKLYVFQRDAGCVGFGRLPGECQGNLEPDHVRVGGMGIKSVTCPCNLVSACREHHRYKTEHGRDVRPVFLEHLAKFTYGPHVPGHLEALVRT